MSDVRFSPLVGLMGGVAIALTLSAVPVWSLDPVQFDVQSDDKAMRRDLQAASSLLAAQSEDKTDPASILAAARAEYGRLVNALYAKGHYSPVVHVLVDGREAASIAPLDVPATIRRVVVQVDPGPRFTFGAAQIAPLAPDTRLPEGFASGRPAESGVVKQAVQVAVDGWRADGHAKAAPETQTFTADHAASRLSAQVTLSPGPRLRFGPLTITGQERMRERRIRKIAGLPEGEVFDPKVLARSAERLRRTGVFKSVSLVEDENITRPDLLGITATVVEEKPRRYSIGAEVASFEGVSLSGYWLHRNLLGGGERFKIEGEIDNIGIKEGGVDYGLNITLDRPATLTPDTTLSFHIETDHLDEVDYDADALAFGFTFSHYINEKLSASVGLEYSYAEVADLSGDFLYRQLSLPLGVDWDSRDKPLDARKGTYLAAEVMPFQGFGTTDSGVRLSLDGRAYKTFGEARPVTFALRGQVGAVFGSDLLGTPRDYLFYSGGGGTVRGQPYQSLGIPLRKIATEDYKIGGKTFVGASAEVRARVTEKIGIVGFVDAAHIGANDFLDDIGDWHAGAGLGVRYDTGFAPIRLDIAAPVGGKTGDGVQFYVGIGQSF